MIIQQDDEFFNSYDIKFENGSPIKRKDFGINKTVVDNYILFNSIIDYIEKDSIKGYSIPELFFIETFIKDDHRAEIHKKINLYFPDATLSRLSKKQLCNLYFYSL